ncbi:hypothetical protein HG531_006180 [Fusarium graminearum]|nr:hypothetical protein HG531_006180 [Fusarium graminearum]
MCPSKTPDLAATPAPVQMVRVSGARTTRNDEKIKVQLVVESVGRWDGGEEARVELVHSHRLCGHWIKCLCYEVKVELLDAERHELERIQRAKDVNHVESLEKDDPDSADLGAGDVGNGTRSDTCWLGLTNEVRVGIVVSTDG